MRILRLFVLVALLSSLFVGNAFGAAAFTPSDPKAVHDTLIEAQNAYKAKEFAKAKRLVEPLAKQNEPISMFMMGLLAIAGGGTQDYKGAERWWKQAADTGFPDAQFNLGMLYYSGALGDADMKKARNLWSKAAGQGHPDGLFGLGLLEMSGNGGSQDKKAGVKNLRAAADKGHPQAMLLLGQAYAQGEGVTKDTKQARQWFEKAKKAGVTAADTALSSLKE